MQRLKKQISILVADDEEYFRGFVVEALRREDYDITEYDPGTSSPDALHKNYDVAILDIVMPDTDGFVLRKEIIKHSPEAQFIIITGHPDEDKLDKAMEAGAFTFLTKPFEIQQIRYAVKGALRSRERLWQYNDDETGDLPENTGLIGNSPSIRAVKNLVKKLGPMEVPILITGESGTGKEIVANYIHELSQRVEKKLIAVNCASFSPGIVESELFGHVQGAFTGATKTKYGFFEAADGGTLFLDEIGDLPLDLQSKLLRVLDKGEFTRIGDTQKLSVNVRIISATNHDLKQMVDEQRFRKDLYYRLRGMQIKLPALRERREDIPLLVRHFLGETGPAVSSDAMNLLQNFEWPGNVRELKMVIESLKGFSSNNSISKDLVCHILEIKEHLDSNMPANLTYHGFKDQVIKKHEKDYFQSLLETANGNISKVARLAKIQRRHLYTKLKNLTLIA